MSRQKMLHWGLVAVLLAIAAVQIVHNYRTDRYIEQTRHRDTAQEQCTAEQAVWLQDWLQWRWIDHVDATYLQIVEYHRIHPQPTCEIQTPR